MVHVQLQRLNSISRKNTDVLPITKFSMPCATFVSRNTIMLQHLIIHFPLYYWSIGCLWEVKNKGKFQSFTSQIGCCRFKIEWWSLTRASKYCIVISHGNFGYFGKLVNEERWSLARGGCNQMLDCITHCHNMNASTHELSLRKKCLAG